MSHRPAAYRLLYTSHASCWSEFVQYPILCLPYSRKFSSLRCLDRSFDHVDDLCLFKGDCPSY